MTALGNSLKRVWPAINHVSGLIVRRTTGLPTGAVCKGGRALANLTRQTAPTILLILWNLLR